eukprot:2735591-Prymnesium_polylepis.1
MRSGRWAEAAHLFRPNLAPNLKMLSSRRHRAGAFDAQGQVSQRSVDWISGGPPQYSCSSVARAYSTSWACYPGGPPLSPSRGRWES